ncbi:hypothetical protein OL548_21455 [Lysinibacillus sp. MHQ-1]|nr:hypothetical protein OL548_21455 [Lysinibacillus sp. MHQ-1]
MSDLHKPANEQEELTEEEFIELVLTEQQKALAQEQEDRLQGKKNKKNPSHSYAGLYGVWLSSCFSIHSHLFFKSIPFQLSNL